PWRLLGPQLRSWVLPGTILLLLMLGLGAMVGHYNESAPRHRFKEAPASLLAALSDSGPGAESGTTSPASLSGLFVARPEAMPLHPPASPSTGSPLIAVTPQAEPPVAVAAAAENTLPGPDLEEPPPTPAFS